MTTRRCGRIFSITVLAGVLAILTGCEGSPSKPSPPGPPVLPGATNVTGLRLGGPPTVGPRGSPESIGQYVALATRVDGSTSDVTTSATWESSDPAVLRPTGRPGEMQGEARGEAELYAKYGGLTIHVPIFVLEPGTFRVVGFVRNWSSAEKIRDAHVAVISGIGAGLETRTNGQGRYALYGAAGPIDIRASHDGFHSDTHRLDVTHPRGQDFRLESTEPFEDVAGNWTMSVSASAQCRDRLPAIARDRTYDATIEQLRSSLTIRLQSSTITSLDDPAGLYSMQGSIGSDRVAFAIVGDTSYDGFFSTNFVDHLSPNESLGMSATGTGIVTGPEIRGSMNGGIEYWPLKSPAGPPSAVCFASDHAVVFRRR